MSIIILFILAVVVMHFLEGAILLKKAKSSGGAFGNVVEGKILVRGSLLSPLYVVFFFVVIALGVLGALSSLVVGIQDLQAGLVGWGSFLAVVGILMTGVFLWLSIKVITVRKGKDEVDLAPRSIVFSDGTSSTSFSYLPTSQIFVRDEGYRLPIYVIYIQNPDGKHFAFSRKLPYGKVIRWEARTLADKLNLEYLEKAVRRIRLLEIAQAVQDGKSQRDDDRATQDP